MQVPANKGRFDIYTETELEEKIKDSVPDGTRKQVRWALNILKEWQNETLNGESRLHMYGDIETSPASTINNELKHFICEVRKKNGSRYPPKTLYDLIVMLNYYLTKEVRRDLNIMKDREFLETRMALNAAMSESAWLLVQMQVSQFRTMKKIYFLRVAFWVHLHQSTFLIRRFIYWLYTLP